jgi:tripartite-type tricarboxylate transporter receptor subunit TctC
MGYRSLVGAVAVALSLQDAPSALAAFPSRPIKVVVPMPAGSAPDIRIRLVAEELSKVLRQQVVVENRAGGGGAIGVQAVLAGEADGHTLLAASASIYTILPVQGAATAFDVNRDLIPIGTIMAEGQVLAVSPKLGVRTLADFVALARAKPDTIAIGTNPAGSLPHLAAKLIAAHAKAPIIIVPFSQGGTNAALTQILGGRIHAVIDGRPSLKGLLDSGDLKALAIMTDERVPSIPDLPTAAETLPGVRAVGWFVLCAPKGTPANAVGIIRDGLREALDAPELIKKVEQIGTPFKPLFGDDLRRFIESEQKLWRPIVHQETKAGSEPPGN